MWLVLGLSIVLAMVQTILLAVAVLDFVGQLNQMMCYIVVGEFDSTAELCFARSLSIRFASN